MATTCPTTVRPTPMTTRSVAPAAYLADVDSEPSRALEKEDTETDRRERLYTAWKASTTAARDILQAPLAGRRQGYAAGIGRPLRRIGRAYPPDRKAGAGTPQVGNGRLRSVPAFERNAPYEWGGIVQAAGYIGFLVPALPPMFRQGCDWQPTRRRNQRQFPAPGKKQDILVPEELPVVHYREEMTPVTRRHRAGATAIRGKPTRQLRDPENSVPLCRLPRGVFKHPPSCALCHPE